MNTRREFVKTLVAGGAVTLLLPRSLTGHSFLNSVASPNWYDEPANEAWAEVPKILARIKPPIFPNHDFKITEYGAAPNNATDCTEPIRKAIEACHAGGGGRVVVPPGVFQTGAIHLKSNVNLYLSEGATLKFFSDSAKYMPVVFTRYEGIECLNYSPLIYAFEQLNIAVTGSGTLDGSAADENWWGWYKHQDSGVEAPARADVRRPLSAAQLYSAVSLPQYPYRGHHHSQLTDVGDSPGA